MKLDVVKIKGFRNFKDLTVNLNEKSLIIGPNDIGKSNFIYAIRLLLDRSLSELDLELVDSDYYAHDETQRIEILLKFSEAVEECIVSKFKENISDDGNVFIKYEIVKTENSTGKNYKLYVGASEAALTEIDSRFYLRALNMSYIDSNRDLGSFIKRERRYLLQTAKDSRTPEDVVLDEKLLKEIATSLNHTSSGVTNLKYIEKATSGINTELNALSVTNSNITVAFDTGASDPKQFVENLKLVTKYNTKTVALGGDGRNNQIYLAMWSAKKNSEANTDPTEVSINCIEEPEAHLHPHQQRSLSKYLVEKLQGQVILTSHSPQIACEFEKNSIVNLFNDSKTTYAANGGCSPKIQDDFIEFGHRLNLISSEGFFATVVLLVEGPSEVIFYKGLANTLGLDLDKYNISIISVAGVGFEVYMKVYTSLGIRTVARTDLDISKVPYKDLFRVAGLSRLIELYQKFFPKIETIEKITLQLGSLHNTLPAKAISQDLGKILPGLVSELNRCGLYLSAHDLEWDLISSPLQADLMNFYGCANTSDLYSVMTSKKAENMFAFLRQNIDQLTKLQGNAIVEPLNYCLQYARSKYEESNPGTN